MNDSCPPPTKKTLQKYNVILDWILYQKKEEKKKVLKRPFLGHWQNLNKMCLSANRVASPLDALNLTSMQCKQIFLMSLGGTH